MLRIQKFVSTLEGPPSPGDRRGCSPSHSPAPSPSLGPPRSPPEAKSRSGPASGGQSSNRGSPINRGVVSAVAAGVASPFKPSKGPRRSASNQSPRRAVTPVASGSSLQSPARGSPSLGSLASGSSFQSPARGSPFPSGLGRRSAGVKCWTQMYLLWEQQLKELHAALAAAAEAVCIMT